MLLLLLLLPMNLPFLVLVSLSFLSLHGISYSLHFILIFVFWPILKILFIIVITIVIWLSLFQSTVVVPISLLSGIRFHSRLWTNVWAHVHLVDIHVLLCAQNLVPLREHRGIVTVGQGTLVPLVVGYSCSDFLFHNLWTQLFVFDQALGRWATYTSSWEITI